ncbi:hypothetical protein HY450_01935 [Candidatus Pacearchaeota archaeon]|nr:hypothetical protein [Candidatus Pacearchaeota archaeon]
MKNYDLPEEENLAVKLARASLGTAQHFGRELVSRAGIKRLFGHWTNEAGSTRIVEEYECIKPLSSKDITDDNAARVNEAVHAINTQALKTERIYIPVNYDENPESYGPVRVRRK